MDLEALKLANERWLLAQGIEINANLPLIEDVDSVQPRSAEEIATRLCAIPYVTSLGFDVDPEELRAYLDRYALWGGVSSYERSLLEAPTITEQDRINMKWLDEAAQALAWSLGLAELDHFKPRDRDLPDRIPFEADPAQFIAAARRRPIEAIQQQSDLLYRMHWYVTHCRIEDRPCRLSWSIITERRKAIDWVYGVDPDWDQIPLDT